MMSRDTVRRVEQRVERCHAHGRLLAHAEFAPHTGFRHERHKNTRSQYTIPLLIIYTSFKYLNIYL